MSIDVAIRSLGYDEITQEIKRTMRRSAKDAVQLGYMLRRVMDGRMYLERFEDFDSYLNQELNMDYTMASRFIKINRKYSVDGDSMEISTQYEDYSQGLLIEMLNMPPELVAKVTPDTTVSQARELKRASKPKPIKPEPVIPTPAPETIEGKFREITLPDPEVATSQPDTENIDLADEQDVMHFTTANEAYGCMIATLVGNYLDTGYTSQEKECDASVWGQTYKVLKRADITVFYTEEGRTVFDVENARLEGEYQYRKRQEALLSKSVEEPEQLLSPYGLPKSEYPEGSLISTEGCGNKYNCFFCAMDCQIRGAYRYCREAPMGNPFPCETMEHIKELPDICQFVDHDLAYHTASSGEADPCCKNCKEDCQYRCERSIPPQETEELTEADTRQDLVTVTPRNILEEQSQLLDDYLAVGGLPEALVQKQKIIVGALAAMVTELEDLEDEEAMEQPELPMLKNNDQRKEWLGSFHGWPVWFRVPEASEVYYRYDLPDGSSIVICEYHAWVEWKARYKDEDPEVVYHKQYLLKPGYHYLHDCETSITELIEHIKNVQKGATAK